MEKFVRNENIVDRLCEEIKPKSITGFQLKDIMVNNYSEESIRDAIRARVQQTKDKKRKQEDPRLAADDLDEEMLKDETEEEKVKRHGYPSYDVEKLFEDCNATKFIEKLKELKITNRLFWTLDEEELQKNLPIDVWGANKRIYNKRREVLA